MLIFKQLITFLRRAVPLAIAGPIHRTVTISLQHSKHFTVKFWFLVSLSSLKVLSTLELD
jgi:hypothetical protein